MRVRSIGTIVALTVALTTVPSTAAPDPDRVPERIERAVVEGSVVKLEALRSRFLGQESSADLYTLAYIDWRATQILDDDFKKKRKQLLKEAQSSLDVVIEREPENAEAHALRGGVIGQRIHGFMGGMFLGPKAKKATQRGFELDATNPRVALQRGIGYLFTPKKFGGGLERAEDELRRAHELFESEPADKAWPNWGRVDALAWLGQTLAKAGKTDEARKTYQQALSLEPEHRWIRDELLPALEADP